jgi:ParB family chromosome partitioning protein
MELRYVDPRTLKDNPDNPRKVQPDPAYDEQLAANIREVGLIQPPLVREISGELVIRAGGRRKRCSIAAGLDVIPVLVMDTEADSADRMRAFAENLLRQGLATVDLWRAMQALAGDGWTDDAIATALNLPPRTVKRLKLCGNILPAILEHMATGDEPQTNHLKTIAQASREDQTQAWKKYRPKKGERVAWWDFARALDKRRMWARDAKFGDDLVKAYGIVWVEDLFEQGDEDNRYTTQVDAFLGAQHEWMSHNLPKKAIILQTDESGTPKLPPKAIPVHGKAGKGTITGHYIDGRDGAIETISYRMPDPPAKKGKPGKAAGTGRDEESNPPDVSAVPSSTRPPVTKDGQRLIGDFQTDALHQALSTAQIDDLTMLGLFVLAASGRNVEVRSGDTSFTTTCGARDAIAGAVVENGVLVHDPETIRSSARRMLRFMLSLRQSGWQSNSGLAARVAGDAIGADTFLANMATQDFLSCLSKVEMERVASAHGVLPRQTGKATRAAFIDRFNEERFTYDGSRFSLTPEEQKEHAAHVSRANAALSEEDDIETDVGGPEEGDSDDGFGDDTEMMETSASTPA